MIDNRLTNKLLSYWNEQRNPLALPEWKDPSEALGDTWENCCVWEVTKENKGEYSYKLTHVGKRIKDWLGQDTEGLIYGHLSLRFPNTRLVKKGAYALENMFPVIDEDVCVSDKGWMVKFRSCMIPFGTFGNATHILVGLSWVV